MLSFAVPFGVPASAWADDPQPKWEKVTSESGINVFKKEVAGSPFIAFKGDGVIDASIIRVVSVLIDASQGKQWVDRLKDSAVLEQTSLFERVQYSHLGTPPGVDDRDFVVKAKLLIDQDNKRLTITLHSVEHAGKPPQPGIVRGELVHSSFLLVPVEGGKTRLIAEMHADPKGTVPAFVVNMIQKDWPINTIKALRKQVGRAGDHPELRTHLIEKGFPG